MHKLLAFVVAVSAGTSPTFAGVLWQNTKSGMTVGQVRQQFPDAAAPSEPSTLGNGSKCELAIESREIAGSKFRVCFFFRAGGLNQVMLTAKDSSEPQFEGLLDLLRSKYGPELGASQPRCKAGLLRICEANWAVGDGTNVSAIFARVGQNDPILNINYQTRIARDASGL